VSDATPGAVDRVPDAHFEERYRADQDPWRLEHRWYERRKRALTMAALTRERYRRAFEPACGPGLLTALLAQRCDEVLAVDVAPSAVRVAARRLARHPHVTVGAMAVPDAWPSGHFDLVVLSEVGYYLAPDALVDLRDAAVAGLTDGGELLAVHYRPDADEHRTNGDDVHDVLRAADGLTRVAWHVDELFRIDVLRAS
jgi:SAM-dependent methyltransferase